VILLQLRETFSIATPLFQFRPLFEKCELDVETLAELRWVELPDGRQFTVDAIPAPGGGSIDYRIYILKYRVEETKDELARVYWTWRAILR
jgi:hypothetical protein